MTTPAPSAFQEAYVSGEPPWIIGEPQPAVIAAEAEGLLRGRVLDLGCGTGEHAVLLAERGYDVVGADSAPAALDRARAVAAAHGVAPEFVEADAMHPSELRGFDTVLDSALFHIFDGDDQARYVDALRDVVVDGGRVVLLGLAPGPAFGPEVTDDEIRTAFSRPGWTLEEIRESTYRGRVPDDDQAAKLGVPVGGHVDLPAWLALARRT
ncbi:SAM-dependent methyltransferase [Actinomycetospora sp. NBRC 106375]|uniref:class I SAM-dependent methyltransferase n=1 Tax=Actinomycetospora sp. NBRC 106375 TaxID=3032207 RepID=UPI00249FFFA2|nr:class I SAM-dependent methyltransferase [Actinomycetospora sp. NBRC 106375]GLZ47463.1 SAM-dependent methyltransferase [Actinomycetospora sp. NBRC 106375]